MTICSTCNDTHKMALRDRMVPCTRCPLPCDDCRGHELPARRNLTDRRGGNGAFCAVTPCACPCHGKLDVRHDGTLPGILREVMRLLGAIGAIGPDHVTIERRARVGDHDDGYLPIQVRFERLWNATCPRIRYRALAPSGEWFPWSWEPYRFDLEDVLASDWRFV